MEIVNEFIKIRTNFLAVIGARPDSIIIDYTNKEFAQVSDGRGLEIFDDNKTIIPSNNFQNWGNSLVITVGRAIYLLDFSKQVVQK